MVKGKSKEIVKKRKVNFKVVFYSLFALGFMYLTFTVDWIYIVGALLMIYLSNRELNMAGKKKK